MSRLTIKIRDIDNVAVAVQDLDAGVEIQPGLKTLEPIPQAHKIALTPIAPGGRDHPLRRGSGLREGGHPRRRLDQRAYAGSSGKSLR